MSGDSEGKLVLVPCIPHTYNTVLSEGGRRSRRKTGRGGAGGGGEALIL